jgi:hypothetical protein
MYSGRHVSIGIALGTTVVYDTVLLGMRVSGKREVANPPEKIGVSAQPKIFKKHE